MNRVFLFKFLSIISVLTPCLAKDPEALSIIQIVTEQPESIEYFDGDKLYLKPGNIYQTNGGIILQNGCSTIALPRLSVDQSGYYLVRRYPEDTMLVCNKCKHKWSILEHASVYCPRPYCDGIGN